jgi:hypothetical protein
MYYVGFVLERSKMSDITIPDKSIQLLVLKQIPCTSSQNSSSGAPQSSDQDFGGKFCDNRLIPHCFS